MAGMHAAATIAKPVGEVFRFFLDLDQNVPKTDPSIESVVKTPEGPTGPGTTFRFRQGPSGKRRETVTRFTAVVAERRIEFEATIGPLRPRCLLTFEQVGEGTRVEFSGHSNPIGPLRLLSSVLDGKGQRIWGERLRRIKTVLETPATQADATDPQPFSASDAVE
jgi:hypothetical protein